MVIGIHVSSIPAIKYCESLNEKDLNFILANFWYGISSPAVPIFVMICGKYALKQKNSNYQEYYSKILKKIYIPTILWSCIYMILRYYCQNISLKTVINSAIGGAPFYHLWYLYMMIGIYLLVPFLVKLKEKIGEKKFKNLGVLLLIISFIIVLFRDFSTFSQLGILKYYWKFNQFKFINYLGYFILGYSLKEVEKKKAIAFLILSIFFLLVSLFFFKEKYKIIYDNNYIWMVFYSISIYLFFLKIKIKRNNLLSFLEKYSFDIYLLHPIVLNIILERFLLQEKWLFIRIPSLIIITFIFSLILGIIVKEIIEVLKNKNYL